MMSKDGKRSKTGVMKYPKNEDDEFLKNFPRATMTNRWIMSNQILYRRDPVV